MNFSKGGEWENSPSFLYFYQWSILGFLEEKVLSHGKILHENYFTMSNFMLGQNLSSPNIIYPLLALVLLPEDCKTSFFFNRILQIIF